ncbi:TetR/AcrR family transcriptional regulator [Croceicoccus marinus]|jgi:AcrR family transcriptional regulator|uniref:TetR family transcriptional regulator n=2 Tax=Croceicoccus marinus TaxID=450378 RepID=A0A1Z1FFV4_9SPHN|nr:TetR/AcrR family transcriptional regulator [Croceicoccus marinus]ARU17616.1 TetR family transcriptional regulator [Croceicoccus marinus]
MKFQPEFAASAEVGDDFVMSPSVIKILSGALDAIAERGVRRLSMSDIIEASGVSRGTLYRYFSSKDDVLAAVAEFVCIGFENGIREAAEGIDDPIERFRQVMQFYARYTNENSPDRVFEVEPRFHLSFFRSRFARYKLAVHSALEPTFKYIEAKLGKTINAIAFVEILVRLQLSTLLVPADENWLMLWNESADSLEKWLLDTADQTV